MNDRFQKDVLAFAKKSQSRMKRLKKGAAIALFESVIMDTPVGNVDRWNMSEAMKARIRAEGYVGGRLRGGWRASFGSPDKSEGPLDKVGSISVAAMTATVLSAPDNEEALILTNSLPYAYRVEYDGWSSIAPQGMVRRNVRRIRKLVQDELRRMA